MATLAGADLSLVIDPPVRLRPGGNRTCAYTIAPPVSGHSLAVSNLPAGVTATVTIVSASGGNVTFAAAAGAGSGAGTAQIQGMVAGAPCTNNLSVPVATDTPPQLSNPGIAATLDEDTSADFDVIFADDTASSVQASAMPGDATVQVIAVNRPLPSTSRISLRGAPDANGPSSVVLTLTDLVGPTEFTIPVTIRPTNDPPAFAVTPIAAPVVMDPTSGAPVPVLQAAAITPGVDAGVHTWINGLGLALIVEMTGVEGVDVVRLRSDATYLVDGGTIRTATDGTAIAALAYVGTTRLDITLTAAGTVAQLDDLAKLIRYAHLQSPSTELARTLRLTVYEPDPAGGSDHTPVRYVPIRILPCNQPPQAALAPVTVEPLGEVPLALSVVDSDGLDVVQVTVAAPLAAGRIEPASCSAAVALAGGMRYIHTAADQFADRIALAVDDGRADPVLVAADVVIRQRPDRLAIISDPLVEVVRGMPVAHAIATFPAGATLGLQPYGGAMPPLAAGVTLSGGSLRIDWDAVPAGTAWLALAIAATTDAAEVPPDRRSAVQRMLVRVREARPTGVGN